MSEMTAKKRDFGIDLCKAILITLVVLGHTVQYAGEGTTSSLFRFIYSFHMAAFMMVSGFVGFNKPLTLGSIVKKVKRLMIPFFVWWLLGALILVLPVNGFCGLLQSFYELLLDPSKGLWFFWDLSALILLLFFIQLLNRECGLGEMLSSIIAWMSMVALSHIVRVECMHLRSISWYMPFFLVGYFLSRRKAIFGKKGIAALMMFLFILFSIGECVYISGNITIMKPLLSLLAGLLILFGACRMQSRFNVVTNAAYLIGSRTLGIYAVHMTVCRCCPIFVAKLGEVLGFVFLFCGALLITLIIERTRLIRVALIGCNTK